MIILPQRDGHWPVRRRRLEQFLGGAVLAIVWVGVPGAMAGPERLSPTLDAGGGRVSAPGISVDCSLGGLGGGVLLAAADAARLQGGFPGSLNEPPLAPDQAWYRPPGLAVKQRVSGLLATVSDAEGDALELVGTGPPLLAAPLQMDNGWLLYQPPASGGEDQFSYLVVDAVGGRSAAVVYVLIQAPAPGPGQNRLGAPRSLPDGAWLLRFLGIPGRTYLLQYTDDLDGPWQAVPGVPDPWVAPEDGLLEAVDHGPEVPTRYYRVLMWW